MLTQYRDTWELTSDWHLTLSSSEHVCVPWIKLGCRNLLARVLQLVKSSGVNTEWIHLDELCLPTRGLVQHAHSRIWPPDPGQMHAYDADGSKCCQATTPSQIQALVLFWLRQDLPIKIRIQILYLWLVLLEDYTPKTNLFLFGEGFCAYFSLYSVPLAFLWYLYILICQLMQEFLQHLFDIWCLV